MPAFIATVELPDQYLKNIARIIVVWAVVELTLKRIIYHLLELDEKRGLVAVRDPRVVDQITMIQQLLGLAKIDEKPFHLNELKKSLEKLQAFRDRIAHGLWGKIEDAYYLKDISGHWRPDPKGPKISRRIKPSGDLITVEYLADKIKQIDNDWGKLIAIRDALRSQTSQGKPP